jgi:hypothetical protein
MHFPLIMADPVTGRDELAHGDERSMISEKGESE